MRSNNGNNYSSYYNSSSYSPYGSSSYTTSITSPWNARTSNQLRSTMSSPSTSSYVSRTHLPFVPQSTLVAHCFTAVQSSTRPYGYSSLSSNLSSTTARTTASSTSGYDGSRSSSTSSNYSSRPASIRRADSGTYTSLSSRPVSTKRSMGDLLSSSSSSMPSSINKYNTASSSPINHTSSYLSPTTYSTSASTSASRSAHRTRPLTPSSYTYRPIRLRERPVLTHIWRQLNTRPSYQVPAARAAYDHSSTRPSSSASGGGADKEPQTNDVKTSHGHLQNDENKSDDANQNHINKTKNSLAAREEDWSSDITRAISRNKYIIKFREFDRRQSTKPDFIVPEETPGETLAAEASAQKSDILHATTSDKPTVDNDINENILSLPCPTISVIDQQQTSELLRESIEKISDEIIAAAIPEFETRINDKERAIIENSANDKVTISGSKNFCSPAEPKSKPDNRQKQKLTSQKAIEEPIQIKIPIKLSAEAQATNNKIKSSPAPTASTANIIEPKQTSDIKNPAVVNKSNLSDNEPSKASITTMETKAVPTTPPVKADEQAPEVKNKIDKTKPKDQPLVKKDSKKPKVKSSQTEVFEAPRTDAPICQPETQGDQQPPTKTKNIKLKLKPVKKAEPEIDNNSNMIETTSKTPSDSTKRPVPTTPESPKSKTNKNKKLAKRKGSSNVTVEDTSKIVERMHPVTPPIDQLSTESPIKPLSPIIKDELSSKDKKQPKKEDKSSDIQIIKTESITSKIGDSKSSDIKVTSSNEDKEKKQREEEKNKETKRQPMTNQVKQQQPEPEVAKVRDPKSLSPNEKRVQRQHTSDRIRFREYNIDDFNFLSVLGHGGWGFVILADLKQHEACFAVKCIKKITIVEDDDYESILIERKVLALGNINPFICKLFCTFETEGYLFFVMEFCAGGDLMFHVQREGKFSEPRCRFYAAEIICAIRFLHNRHIIYRDLKLDNILLDSHGHIRLVDFGMCQCRTYREEMLPSNFCGTPEYISPEIIKGVPYNHSVDWWSFGVLLYEMAVGKMPFRGNDENELLWNVCYEQIHYPLFLSRELTILLQQLLEREPTKRMGMATCKAGDIKDQAWFKGTDWVEIEAMRVKPPFVPRVESRRDVQNFDADFTESQPELSPVDDATLARIDQKQFQKFPYTNPDIHIFDSM